jgi:hypothetical protein
MLSSFETEEEIVMAANARVTGKVEYRAGDGPLIPIPPGPIEVDVGADSAVISWGEGDAAQRTAIPLAEYQRYVAEGLISEAR